MVAALLKDFFESGQHNKLYSVLKPVQWVVSFLLVAVTFLIVAYVFPAGPLWIAVWAVVAAVLLYIAFNRTIKPKMFWLSVAAIIGSNIMLTHVFYYRLMDYQLGNVMAEYIEEEKIPAAEIIHYRMVDPLNAFHFYAESVISKDSFAITTDKYVLTQDVGIAALADKGYTFDTVKTGKCFRISELKPAFLNPATREESQMNYYFLKIK